MRRVTTTFAAHVRTWRPYTLWYVGLVGLAGAALAADRPTVARLAAAWLVPTLVWIAAHYLGDYLDRDLDAIAKPQRPIPSGQMRPGTALGCGVALAVGAGAVALAVNWRVLLVFLAGIGGAVAYNGFFKARGIWGNLVRGSLTGAAFLCGELMTAPAPVPRLLPFVLAFCLHDTASNLVGALRDVDGDRAGGYRTFAVRHGLRRGVWTSAGLYAASIAAVVTGLLLVPRHDRFSGVLLVVATGLGCHAWAPLVRAGDALSARTALRSHATLVVERVVLAAAVLVPGLGAPVTAALVTPMLLVTAASQRLMRTRHEFTPAARPVLWSAVTSARRPARTIAPMKEKQP
ncbi:UbiA family prenyltransferase [Actinoplanes flavus]|uniref:UbiA family prenyltransferase n=1 Tax=Actinoplanes flavus TaxID=2820290 RepID=A0ABS3URC9_9ACTN|nr:UbiA family prenyltransferase [Actinoplanes flavus]MBO3741334.1 UbiA family prenyltransferase [Actinoplanes flavus]